MSLAIVVPDEVMEAKGGLDTPREVNVYVTSRLSAGRRKFRDYTSTWNHNSRMLIHRVSIAQAFDRAASNRTVAPSIFADVAL